MGVIIKKAVFTSLIIGGLIVQGLGQVYDAQVATYIKKVDNAYGFLQKIEQLGRKQAGDKGLDSTFFWIKQQIENLGYTTLEQKFLEGQDTLRNLEFVKTGDLDTCIIIGGHYDSKGGAGVNDNGTGNFALYEIARLIKNVRTKYSIRFVFFSGEEVDYLGSRYYVKHDNKSMVKFMLNIDQLGGTIGEDNSGIKCERDEVSGLKAESNQLATVMAKIYDLYTTLNPVITPAYASDYLSFRDSGYIITGIYQYSNFPYIHSSNDLLKYMELNTLHETVKGALAYVLHFSKAIIPASIHTKNEANSELNVYCSGSRLYVNTVRSYDLLIYNSLGQLISCTEGKMGNFVLSLNLYNSGVYYTYIKTAEEIFRYKFIFIP